MEEMVEITKSEYDKLLVASDFLDSLRAAGVDNWDGYDIAIDLMNGEG